MCFVFRVPFFRNQPFVLLVPFCGHSLRRKLFELRLGAAAGEDFLRQVPAFGDGFGFVRDEQRGAGIQQHGIAFWARVLVAQ